MAYVRQTSACGPSRQRQRRLLRTARGARAARAARRVLAASSEEDGNCVPCPFPAVSTGHCRVSPLGPGVWHIFPRWPEEEAVGSQSHTQQPGLCPGWLDKLTWTGATAGRRQMLVLSDL